MVEVTVMCASFLTLWLLQIKNRSWFGVLALMQSIVNQATIGPIVLFVGLAVCEEALNFMPSRHYPAFIIGLFPSIYDWVVNISARSPIQDFETGGNIHTTGLDNWFGVLAWKRGALLVSFVWVAMLVMVIDRRWSVAAFWAALGAGFALFGIIHVPEAGFENFNQPVWEQCKSSDECWEYGEQWMFFLAYILLLVTFALLEASRRFGWDTHMLPPIEDEDEDAGFGDWFAQADIDTRHLMADDIAAGVHDGKEAKDPDSTVKTNKMSEDGASPEGDLSKDDELGNEIEA